MRIECEIKARSRQTGRQARALAGSVNAIEDYYFNWRATMREKKKQDSTMDEPQGTRAATSAIRERRISNREPEDEQNLLRALIARRAYEIYEERGRSDGEDVNDWLRAEAEVRSAFTTKDPGLMASRARARQ
jgi:hypothetical protein